MSIKDKINEIQDASEKMLVRDYEGNLAKELLKDLLNKAMTEEEIQEIEDKYTKHFKEDEILEIIYQSKKERGFIRD